MGHKRADEMILIDQYKKMHEEGAFRGLSALHFAADIAEHCRRIGIKSLLDYGCGAGDQYRKPYEIQGWWGIEQLCLYDPATKFDMPPLRKFDAVICTDVLEHIPESEIDLTLSHMLWFAEKFAFLTVCCRPAHKNLPNGMNCHVTIKPMEWWRVKIAERAKCEWILRETP